MTGQDMSYIYVGENRFDNIAIYSARLTRTDDGAAIFTCDKETETHTDISLYPTIVDAGYYIPISAKTNGTITILSMHGVLVSKDKLARGENDIKSPMVAAAYIMIVELEGMPPVTQVLIVK